LYSTASTHSSVVVVVRRVVVRLVVVVVARRVVALVVVVVVVVSLGSEEVDCVDSRDVVVVVVVVVRCVGDRLVVVVVVVVVVGSVDVLLLDTWREVVSRRVRGLLRVFLGVVCRVVVVVVVGSVDVLLVLLNRWREVVSRRVRGLLRVFLGLVVVVVVVVSGSVDVELDTGRCVVVVVVVALRAVDRVVVVTAAAVVRDGGDGAGVAGGRVGATVTRALFVVGAGDVAMEPAATREMLMAWMMGLWLDMTVLLLRNAARITPLLRASTRKVSVPAVANPKVLKTSKLAMATKPCSKTSKTRRPSPCAAGTVSAKCSVTW
jgi:hypothetical protein